jgi:hypothetical protein
VGEYAEAFRCAQEGEVLAAKARLNDLEKWGLDQKIHALFWLDRWDEVLGLDEKLRDMNRRYPREQIGPSCYEIAMIARIHAFRGELDIAHDGRRNADAIMSATFGKHDAWLQFQHY